MSTKDEREADMRIVPTKQHKKNTESAYFKLVGGPHHGHVMRMTAPWDDIIFQTENGPIIYRLHPPVGKDGEWVYIHTFEGTDND